MISIKNYKCCGSSCSKKRQEKTNHYGKIYNIFCPVCASEGRSPLQSWECTDPIPEDGWVPPEWIEDKISISEAADLQEEAEAMGWDD